MPGGEEAPAGFPVVRLAKGLGSGSGFILGIGNAVFGNEIDFVL
jgi:hypothetical protein